MSSRREHGERWAPVPGWPGYEASTRGRARSVDRVLGDGRRAGGVILSQTANTKGYLYVTLSDGKRRRRAHVAALVLEAFGGPCPPGMEALHGNGRRRDNRLSNLRWGTKLENRADREKHRAQRTARRTRVPQLPAGPGSGTATGETAATAPCALEVVPGAPENRR